MNMETVTVPKEHAGVGAALQAAFKPTVPGLPEDLARLLIKLN